MGRGGALWNDRGFFEVGVGTWRYIRGTGESSYVEKGIDGRGGGKLTKN